MSDNKKIKEAVEKYLGCKVKKIECVQDPKVSSCTAIQITFDNGEKQHMLYDSRFSDPEEGLEEVEFDKWPPTSSERNMYKLENMRVMTS